MLRLCLFLSVFISEGCAVYNGGQIDDDGKNALERGLEGAMGLRDPDSPEEKAKAISANLENLPPAPKKEAPSEKTPEMKPEAQNSKPVEPPPPPPEASARKKPPFTSADLPEKFPEPQLPKEALKKYLNLKKDSDKEEVLIPPAASQQTSSTSEVDIGQTLRKVTIKEKFPGVIIYTSPETDFQTSSRDTLEKLADKLIKNPDQAVLFQGQMGEGESLDIIDTRFLGIKSYLVGLHVNPDQIILDEKRTAGDWPEFKMYILGI
ncbi:MAG: hypothetical protein JWQ35_1453 [Bacteriovoracaceae bacterium]|nr:hypothetical protein [Bacteriovoracaceae bacterium]